MRNVGHQTAIRSPNFNFRNHYRTAKKAVSRKMVILTRMLDEGVELRCAENLFFPFFGSYLRHVANSSMDTVQSLGRQTFMDVIARTLFDISKNILWMVK